MNTGITQNINQYHQSHFDLLDYINVYSKGKNFRIQLFSKSMDLKNMCTKDNGVSNIAYASMERGQKMQHPGRRL